MQEGYKILCGYKGQKMANRREKSLEQKLAFIVINTAIPNMKLNTLEGSGALGRVVKRQVFIFLYIMTMTVAREL